MPPTVHPLIETRRDQMFPVLEPAEIDRLARFGELKSYATGECIVATGEIAPGAFVILAGQVNVTQRGRMENSELIVTHGPGSFMGELAQLSGRPSLVDAYAKGAVEALVIPPRRLRDLMVEEAELGERIMRALILRRVGLLETGAVGLIGLLAEKQQHLDEAEQFYIKGSLLATPGVNPNRTSLQTLYTTRKGSLDGYDAYVANLGETDRANCKADIAKTRAASPRALAPFRLRSLDGTVVSLESVRGKTTVINNWGMWCGPCVAEMPEFQNLATKYASDSTVRILTIDNDPNTDELRTWLQKKSYTFTTLIDDGYLSRSNLHAFPTTWFLDPSGRVVFTKTGWSEKVVEEFGWRIDMIRGLTP